MVVAKTARLCFYSDVCFLSIPVCSCDLEQINMFAPTENPLAPDTHVSDFTPSRERFSTFLIELCFFHPYLGEIV